MDGLFLLGKARMARELLYRKLAEKWIRAISTGVHPVGTLLPSEQELMKSKGSRATPFGPL